MTTAIAQAVSAAVPAVGASPAFYIAVVLYGVASLLYVSAFVDAPAWLGKLSVAALVAAFFAHFIDIGWRGVEGIHPGMGVREALGFLSWLFVGGYLAALLKLRLAVLGAFVAPAALLILAAARLTYGDAEPSEASALGRIHISLATFGVGIFTVASLVAAVYLFQERALKRKDFDGVLLANSSALETLDRIAHRLILVGFPIFTAAIVVGVLWVTRQGIDAMRIEYPIGLIAWAVFAVLVVARTTRGWRGRRAALLTLFGFASAVLVLTIYFMRRAFF